MGVLFNMLINTIIQTHDLETATKGAERERGREEN